MYHILSKLNYMHGPLLGAEYCLKSAKFSLQIMEIFSFSPIVFFFPNNIVAELALSFRRGNTLLCNIVEHPIPGRSEGFFN